MLIWHSIYILGLLVLCLTSLPLALEQGAGLGGLIGAFILIGLGVGGVKSSVAPFTGENHWKSLRETVNLKLC